MAVPVFLIIKPGESGDQGNGELSTDRVRVLCAGRVSSPRSCGSPATPHHPPVFPSPFPLPQPFLWARTSRWHQNNRKAPPVLPSTSPQILPQHHPPNTTGHGAVAATKGFQLSTLKACLELTCNRTSKSFSKQIQELGGGGSQSGFFPF